MPQKKSKFVSSLAATAGEMDVSGESAVPPFRLRGIDAARSDAVLEPSRCCRGHRAFYGNAP